MSLTRLSLVGCLVALSLILAADSMADEQLSPVDRDGGIYEIDRRSHSAINREWLELSQGELPASLLHELSALGEARLIKVVGEVALIWLSQEAAESLRSQGVRLNRPRARPAEPRRFFPPNGRAALPDPTLDQAIANAVSAAAMIGHLDEISTALQTRYYNTSGMVAASQYAFDRFSDYGLDDFYFDDFNYNGYAIRNVVGVKTGNLYPDEIYMVCGHLDSTSPQHDTLAPGAEDNGSGSAGVLEAARLLAPLETEATVYFVCFTAEEQGLVGSTHLAQIADQENWDLRGVLNMDMVGFDTAGPLDIWLEGFYGNPGSIALMDLLEEIANDYTDMGVYRYPTDGWGSDHVPFDQHGFPALLTIDYDWDNYPCYHQTCDVVENIVPFHYREMVAVVAVAASRLAGVQSALGWVDGTADRTDSEDDGGITIDVVGTAYPPVTTGVDGLFLLSDLLPGDYTLRASALGYETVLVPVTISAGQATPVSIPLDPVVSSIVSGNVTLGEGGALAGALVFATGQTATSVTGPSGDYLLDPVYPGEVLINAIYQDRLPGVVILDVPEGGEVTDVDFALESVWDFEDSADGLQTGGGWEWGTDGVAGAHSGTKIWGTRLGSDYANCADYRLDLPPFDLTYFETARLHFWHWYDAESSYDGGNIQVSTDSGNSWSVVTPVDGYTDELTGNCNPLAGMPGFGGTGTNWNEEIIDLADFMGQAIRIRFWFGSDGGVHDRGWYLDDLSLEGTLQATDAATQAVVPGRLLSGLIVQPNPSIGQATIRFDLGAAAPVWLTIYDAAGRKIRHLLEDQPMREGARSVSWNRRDDAGRDLPAGVYWIRVSANGRTEYQRLTILK